MIHIWLNFSSINCQLNKNDEVAKQKHKTHKMPYDHPPMLHIYLLTRVRIVSLISLKCSCQSWWLSPDANSLSPRSYDKHIHYLWYRKRRIDYRSPSIPYELFGETAYTPTLPLNLPSSFFTLCWSTHDSSNVNGCDHHMTVPRGVPNRLIIIPNNIVHILYILQIILLMRRFSYKIISM